MNGIKKTLFRRRGTVIFAAVILFAGTAVGLYLGLFRDPQEGSWKQPSLENTMATIFDYAYSMEGDTLQSLKTPVLGAFSISEDSTYREDGTSKCGVTVVLSPVLKRLFLNVIERAKCYQPQYTTNEIKEYLVRHGNTLLLEFEAFDDYESELKDYVVVIVQGSTVIRPTSQLLPPVIHSDVLDILFKSTWCQVPRYKVDGEITFDVTELDPNRPFQIKMVKRTGEVSLGVDFAALGWKWLSTGFVPSAEPAADQ